jgi:hypothetical protein
MNCRQPAASAQLVLIAVDLGQHVDLKVVMEVLSHAAVHGNNVAGFEARVRRVLSTGNRHCGTALSLDFGRREIDPVNLDAQHLIEARPMPDPVGKK